MVHLDIYMKETHMKFPGREVDEEDCIIPNEIWLSCWWCWWWCCDGGSGSSWVVVWFGFSTLEAIYITKRNKQPKHFVCLFLFRKLHELWNRLLFLLLKIIFNFPRKNRERERESRLCSYNSRDIATKRRDRDRERYWIQCKEVLKDKNSFPIITPFLLLSLSYIWHSKLDDFLQT